MKKILFVLLIALCGASFSFGGSIDECVGDCMKVKQNRSECIGDCAINEIAETQKIPREREIKEEGAEIYHGAH